MLGFITDTITNNQILGRTFNSMVKQRVIINTTIVKEYLKKSIYGKEGGFNKADVISPLGFGMLIKNISFGNWCC